MFSMRWLNNRAAVDLPANTAGPLRYAGASNSLALKVSRHGLRLALWVEAASGGPFSDIAARLAQPDASPRAWAFARSRRAPAKAMSCCRLRLASLPIPGSPPSVRIAPPLRSGKLSPVFSATAIPPDPARSAALRLDCIGHCRPSARAGQRAAWHVRLSKGAPG
jgi:hypothetical protein